MRFHNHLRSLIAPVLAAVLCPVVVQENSDAQDVQRSSNSANQAGSFIECQGVVVPVRRFTVKLRAGEELEKLLVAEGEHVKAGQPLLRISNLALTSSFLDLLARKQDYQILQDEVETQELQLNLQHAELDRLRKRLEKIESLRESVSDLSMQSESEPLSEKKQQIEDQIATGTDRLKQLQRRLDDQEQTARFVDRELEIVQSRIPSEIVVSPFAGTIVRRVLDSERPGPDEIVLELWDESDYLVELQVLQHQLKYIKSGTMAMVALDFTGTDRVEGTVGALEPGDLDKQSPTHPEFKVLVKLHRSVPWLRPGMQVSVRIQSGPQR